MMVTGVKCIVCSQGSRVGTTDFKITHKVDGRIVDLVVTAACRRTQVGDVVGAVCIGHGMGYLKSE